MHDACLVNVRARKKIACHTSYRKKFTKGILIRCY